MLWCDKYQPKKLGDLGFHGDLNQHLQKLSQMRDFPHLLFYGPSGAGKKTRIQSFLHGIYGNGALKKSTDLRVFKTPTNREIEVHTFHSPFHVEFNISELSGNNDRFVIQELIKEMAQSPPLSIDGKLHPFRVIVLHAVDMLSADAQHALRRTMERYIKVCRLVLCCSSTNALIQPLVSRCLALRVPHPPIADTVQALLSISKAEHFDLSPSYAERIVLHANRNVRRAILTLECCHRAQNPIQENMDLPRPDWECKVAEISNLAMLQQNPKQVLLIRNIFYDLLSHCIPPQLLLYSLLTFLSSRLDNALKYELVQLAAEFSHRIVIGSKPIFHLEAFICKFMAMYKKFIIMQL